jgi:hypothetical protein
MSGVHFPRASTESWARCLLLRIVAIGGLLGMTCGSACSKGHPSVGENQLPLVSQSHSVIAGSDQVTDGAVRMRVLVTRAAGHSQGPGSRTVLGPAVTHLPD